MRKKNHTTYAAIHLGSEMTSMRIIEYSSVEKYKIIDSCNRRIRLGEETFKNKVIPFSMVNEICEVLQGFKRLMEEYGVEEYDLQATTAFREATNQLFLLDQIYSRTGLKVNIVDMPQETHTKFVTTRYTLKKASVLSPKDTTLMLDISSGGLGVTLMQEDQIKYQENIHIGIIRVKESFDRNKRESLHFNSALTEYISSTISPVRTRLQAEKARYLILSGTENDLLQHILGLDYNTPIHRIKTAVFLELFSKARKLNLPQLMSQYDIPEHIAEFILPTILLYEQLLSLQPIEEVIITNDRYIDGMQLIHIALRTDKELCTLWENELISFVHYVGRRYCYDKKHASQVEKLALVIFDKIAKGYGMGPRERVLLRSTALLHDLGKYICLRNHTVYTAQLILSMDILGFSEREKQIMAMAAYYHAYDIGDQLPPSLQPVTDPQRMAIVAKLAAIIRLADAMDRSYTQKIKAINISLKENTLYFQVSSKQDISLEKWTFNKNNDFFEEVYGLKAVLERVN